MTDHQFKLAIVFIVLSGAWAMGMFFFSNSLTRSSVRVDTLKRQAEKPNATERKLKLC